jgi:hypothetical protein
MILGAVKDNEANKFALNSDSNVAVRTITEVSGGSIAYSFSGLRERLKISNLSVTDVVAALPLVSLLHRNSIIVHNLSTTASFFIGESDVTAIGVTQGWEIEPTAFFSTDVTADIILYAIAPLGETVLIKIMELA